MLSSATHNAYLPTGHVSKYGSKYCISINLLPNDRQEALNPNDENSIILCK